ncbi:NUDIX domain-containing protein [Streptomyces sp. NPDC088354]|uniref:NUDIX hydrolase n=1 Tax=unclassified Streptomyces TaxID=2593676 RepID=UPI0029B6AA74|nr:NUDIX domain-containing protein [Streptomyces sp. MI02-7b]MDX3072743.1 NUDIX domain-containing protein [Streptomyces sp. MI02-7b]
MPAVTPEPRQTTALIVNRRGQYLLHLRDADKPISDPGTWSLPGGAREGEETPEEAIARELLEEAGLTIGLTRFGVVEHPGPDGLPRPHIQIFLGQWDGDPSRLEVGEGIMFAFFDVATTAHLTMAPWAARVIARHQAAGGAVPTSGGGPGRQIVPNVVGAHLYLERDGQVLLGLRHPDSRFAPLQHHFLAGHCEQESAVACLVREAREEAGLVIDPDDVEFAHAVHMLHMPGTRPRLQLVFRARQWKGEPQLLEPDKCVSWDWWPADRLPDSTVPYTRAAIDGILHGRPYTEMGWA